jgi:SnoaL-like domain
MNNDMKAVWDRYVSSWNSESQVERRALFADTLAPDCVYRDPRGEARGWDELAEWMAGFHAQMPGTRFVMETFSTHHGRSVARWRMQSTAGLALGSGISYGEYDEGQRLLAMTVFFDDPEPHEGA